MKRLFLILIFLMAPSYSGGLNDTGILTCGDATSTSVGLCSSVMVTFPRQDALNGRDAQPAGTLLKIGGGDAGFDFTKIASNGGDCVRDNVTGLIWEVKTDPTKGGLRSSAHTYTRFDGIVGTVSGGTCATTGRCDTEKFIYDVNHMSPLLCGYSDWRMPTVKELESIVNFGLYRPAAEITYFPLTRSASYWTATVQAANPSNGTWTVNFIDGKALANTNNTANPVRLVRGQP